MAGRDGEGEWLRDARAKYPITEEEALAVLTDADPRGRVKLYCGRCGEWKPSDEERTLPEHWDSKHKEVAR